MDESPSPVSTTCAPPSAQPASSAPRRSAGSPSARPIPLCGTASRWMKPGAFARSVRPGAHCWLPALLLPRRRSDCGCTMPNLDCREGRLTCGRTGRSAPPSLSLIVGPLPGSGRVLLAVRIAAGAPATRGCCCHPAAAAGRSSLAPRPPAVTSSSTTCTALAAHNLAAGARAAGAALTPSSASSRAPPALAAWLEWWCVSMFVCVCMAVVHVFSPRTHVERTYFCYTSSCVMLMATRRPHTIRPTDDGAYCPTAITRP
jgi:hypothetical protein